MSIRYKVLIVTWTLLFGAAGSVSASPRRASVGGTWACVAHGTSQGDLEYTFNFKQAGEQVTGNFTQPSPDGGTATHNVQSGSFKNGKLTLQFDDDNGGTIDVTGGISGKDAMKGDWTHGDEGGSWECKRSAAATKGKH